MSQITIPGSRPMKGRPCHWCVDERKLLGDIERLLRRDLPRAVIPGYEPDPSIRAVPIQKGRGARAGSGSGNRNGAGQPRGKRPGNGGGAKTRQRSETSAGRGTAKGAAGAKQQRKSFGKSRRRPAA